MKLPKLADVTKRLVYQGMEELTRLERVVWYVHYGYPLDALEEIEALLGGELAGLDLAPATRATLVGPKPGAKPTLPGDVTIQMAAITVLQRAQRWVCTREVMDAVACEDGIDAEISTTTVSVALQKAHKRGLVAKGPHPGNLRLVRWHHDPKAEPDLDPCPLCGRDERAA